MLLNYFTPGALLSTLLLLYQRPINHKAKRSQFTKRDWQTKGTWFEKVINTSDHNKWNWPCAILFLHKNLQWHPKYWTKQKEQQTTFTLPHPNPSTKMLPILGKWVPRKCAPWTLHWCSRVNSADIGVSRWGFQGPRT